MDKIKQFDFFFQKKKKNYMILLVGLRGSK